MAERVVISRSGRTGSQASGNFQFTKDQSPVLSGKVRTTVAIKAYREKAWQAYNSLPMPTTNEEPWRRTELRRMQLGDFRLATPEQTAELKLSDPPAELLTSLTGDEHGGQVILTPAGAVRNVNEKVTAQGVVFCDFHTAEIEHPELLSKILGEVVRPDEGKFAALVGAFAENGVLVYVPRGVKVEQPLHSILWGPGINLAYLSHILVFLEEGASLTYIHEAASHTEPAGQTMHAGIVEIMLNRGANLRFVELQSWGEHVWNFSHERVRVASDAHLDWVFGAIGSHLTKNFSEIDLVGRGAFGRMSGFYFTDGDQHLDHDTQQNHLAPNTTSDLLFKGALRDQSRSVWQGMIYVAPGAQKADGYQANRNLVLSRGARADLIPGLEIMADDVRCTHGATVGKIDPEQIFYLRSRGIPTFDAERLIVEGFFDPIMQRIPFDGVRARFVKAIEEKMGAIAS